MENYQCARCQGGVCSECHAMEQNKPTPTAEDFMSLFSELSESGKKLVAQTILTDYNART